jgi:hypothetical protein
MAFLDEHHQFLMILFFYVNLQPIFNKNISFQFIPNMHMSPITFKHFEMEVKINISHYHAATSSHGHILIHLFFEIHLNQQYTHWRPSHASDHSSSISQGHGHHLASVLPPEARAEELMHSL